MNEIIKIIAQYFVALPVLIAVYTFLKLPNKQTRLESGSLLVIGSIISLALAQIGGHIINDPRPFVVGHFTPLLTHTKDNGFPSDHTLLSSFIGFAILTYAKKVGVAVLLIAALIGAARVAAGVHHVEDIVGSFAITAIATVFALQAVRFLPKLQKRLQKHA